MTPTWEEITPTLIALVQETSGTALENASHELKRMAVLADIASIAMNAHRRPDAPTQEAGEVIKAALSSLREILSYEDDQPAPGTLGAEIYARATQAVNQLDAIAPKPTANKSQ